MPTLDRALSLRCAHSSCHLGTVLKSIVMNLSTTREVFWVVSAIYTPRQARVLQSYYSPLS